MNRKMNKKINQPRIDWKRTALEYEEILDKRNKTISKLGSARINQLMLLCALLLLLDFMVVTLPWLI